MIETIKVTSTVAGVLAAFLSDVGERQYGFDLMRKVKIGSGSLYPILARLERAGWITGHREDANPDAPGRPPRRYYLLTGDGEVAAHRALMRKAAPHADARTWKPVLGGGAA